jgi:hypothetical protein
MSVASAALFDDPAAWAHVARDVPIFAEHEKRNPDGTVEYAVGRAELEESARWINEAWGKHTPVAFPLGHSKMLKDAAGKVTGWADQREQPPVAALGAGGAYVAALGDKLGLFVRSVHYRKEHWDQAKECLHRSAEYYRSGASKGRIPAVALLKSPAELDLGVTLYHAGGPGGLTLYALAMDPTAEPDADDEVLPEEKEKFHRLFAACYPKLAAMEEELDQGPGPGVNPMTQPAATPPAAPAPQPYQPDAAALAQYEARITGLGAELAATKAALAATQTELRLQQYGAELGDLAQYHVFDVAEELADCKDLDRAAFDKHKGRIKKYEKKLTANPNDPSGPMVPVAPEVPAHHAADPDVISVEHANEAIQYQRGHDGVTWEEALEKTKKKGAA